MKRPGRLLCAAAIAVAALAACAPSGDGRDGSGEPVRIGVVVDQTGALASLGLLGLNGVQLAVDQANEAGGVDGRRIELLIHDGASDPAVAAAAARSLSTQTSAVIGGTNGGACRAMQPILDAAEVLQFCLSPQSFELTPRFFWYMAPVGDYAPATLPWLRSLGVHRIGFIGQKDASGDGYLSLFAGLAAQHPGEFEIVAEQRFDSGATNLETQMTQLRDARPDLIIAGTSGGNIVPVAQAAKALGMGQPIWVGTGSASPNSLAPLARDLPSGGLFANAFWVDVAGELPAGLAYAKEITAFVDAYRKAYGETPLSTAAGPYDVAGLVIAALRAGAVTGTEIARHTERTAYTGVLGPYRFGADKHQGAAMSPVIMTYTGPGGFELAFSA